MGINLGGMSAPTPVLETQKVDDGAGGLTLNMAKNQFLDLTKSNPGLTRLTAGLGWDSVESAKQLTGEDFDLDAVAFTLRKGKLHSVNDVCYFGAKDSFGNLKEVNGCKLSGDNRNGLGEGDDEKIFVDFNKVPSDVDSIVFAVIIYEATKRKQTFGMVSNAYIRLMDANNGDKELCRFILSDDYGVNTAVIVAEAYRDGAEWKYKTIGTGLNADINGVAKQFL